MGIETCPACGKWIEVDHALGVNVLTEPRFTETPGRGHIIVGGVDVHECAPGTYLERNG